MPIYEFECPGCGLTIEKIQRQAASEVECPSCNKPATRKVSAATVSSTGQTSACAAPGGTGFS